MRPRHARVTTGLEGGGGDEGGRGVRGRAPEESGETWGNAGCSERVKKGRESDRMNKGVERARQESREGKGESYFEERREARR